MPNSSRVVPFKGQRYSPIRRKCARKNALFVDGEFPPSGSSIYHSRPAPADIIWKRPKDIVADPKFFIDKASADDFAQGEIANCWFVAACACIAEDSRMWKKIVPDYKSQEWSPDNKYVGMFHFNFWRCGVWHSVVIDDYLPTRQGRLIFLHSKSRNEFWSALLEKAYAKLFGSYEALSGGKARDAMVDMTGGVGESLEISNFRSEDERMRLFTILHKAMDYKSLMSSSIMARSAADMEAKLSCGLVKGHAYSVTDVKKIPLKGTCTSLFNFLNRDKILMIRLRNPWGGMEWRGPWSDGSIEWKKVSEKEKKDLGLTFDDNGEFWMSFDDYCRYFTNIDICHIINTSLLSLKKTWKEVVIENEWRRPQRAGGCGNHRTFLNNPQYLFKLSEDEEEVLLSVEQEDRRSVGIRDNNYVIGVTIMKTDLNRKCRMHDKQERVHAGPFVQSRSVFARVTLPKGIYCFIPSTFDPGQEGRFIMRFYSANVVSYKELKRDVPKPPGCFGDPAQFATAVNIVNAEKPVNKQGDNKDLEMYCIILCEKKEIRTPAVKLSEKWNHRATFYRKKPNEDIEIQVWETNLLRDAMLGSVTLPMSKAHEYTGGNIIRRYDLTIKGDDDKTERTGFIWLNVFHTPNLDLV
ncbi:calpain-5-like [Gigantopelta aegis]|uniref:calpain-5-like n=1 Tax=Gigantopelta aegis TaxID=1735272 RepID=UPI001B88D054|nr:calpain-5-like [Gigantopelta aegis]XP_041359534.1 calpain-5-like [Gigantopelta aegis]